MNRGRPAFRARGGNRGGRSGTSRKDYFLEKTRTNLPAKLLDELNSTSNADGAPEDRRFSNNRGGPIRFKNHARSRKEQRKAEREQKKKGNDAFHRKGRSLVFSNAARIQKTAEKPTDSVKRSRDDKAAETSRPAKKVKASEVDAEDPEMQTRRLEKFAAKNPELYKRLKKDNLVASTPMSAEQAKAEDDDDERDMKRYAKLLGIKSAKDGADKKKLPSSFRKDGLAEILEELGGFEVNQVVGEPGDEEDSGDDGQADDGLGVDSEDEDGWDKVGLEGSDEDDGISEDIDERDLDGLEDDGSDDEPGSSEGEFVDPMDAESDEDDSEDDSALEMDSEDEDDSSDEEPEDEPAPKNKPTDPVPASTYIPPHLRAKDPKQSEQYQRLKRHLRGQLNRLTDSNMESIFTIVEEAYRTHPRRDVTDIVTDSILDYIVNTAQLLDTFVLTQAAFVGLVHNLMGPDIASHIAEEAITRFLAAYESQKDKEEDEQRDKICLNLLTFLCYLYDIKVVSCIVLYDLIREFIASLRTLDVELLLRTLKISGYHLRSDDPSSLKDIVLSVQSKVNAREKGTNSFRLDFMIETIVDLKNNKRKLGAAGQNDDLERLRKFLMNMVKKRLAVGSEPLRFGLKDLREADKKGKWWITGAAWVGRDSGDQNPFPTGDSDSEAPASANQALLDLARKMNMNTDVRRNIFIVLMSSEDYADAVEKLLKMKLKDKQDREIARVIVLCAAQERVHNPYYELVAARFCNLNHGFKITFQYVLWDEIKSVGEADVRRISNMAKLYGHLIAVRALSISVLKAIAFETLSPKQLLFLRILFHTILIHPIPNSLDLDGYLHGIFGTLPPNGDFDALKVGVGIFLAKYLVSSDKNDAVVKQREKADIEAKLKKIRKILRPKD